MSDFLTAHRALLNWADKAPDRVFLCQPVDGELRTHTWQQSADASRRIASGLLALGLRPGDKVAILAKNCAEWILADIAISMAGMISVPIYPTANADTIAYIVGQSEASAVFIGKLDEPDVAIEGIPATVPKIAFPYRVGNSQHKWQ